MESAEFWVIIGVGIALAGLVVNGHIVIGRRLERMEDGLSDLRKDMESGFSDLRRDQAELRERMAKLEGLLEGLREAMTGRRTA